MSSKPIINSKEAAQLLQMSSAYVCTLALEGLIPAFKLGDDWRFVTDQLISYMADKASKQQREREHESESEKKHKNTSAPQKKTRGRPRSESEKKHKNTSAPQKKTRGRPRNKQIDFSKHA